MGPEDVVPTVCVDLFLGKDVRGVVRAEFVRVCGFCAATVEASFHVYVYREDFLTEVGAYWTLSTVDCIFVWDYVVEVVC